MTKSYRIALVTPKESYHLCMSYRLSVHTQAYKNTADRYSHAVTNPTTPYLKPPTLPPILPPKPKPKAVDCLRIIAPGIRPRKTRIQVSPTEAITIAPQNTEIELLVRVKAAVTYANAVEIFGPGVVDAVLDVVLPVPRAAALDV